MTPWLITRAIQEATTLVERLERLGVAAAALPCIERAPIEWMPDLASWTGRQTIFMVTSPFGARRLLAYWSQLRGRGRIAALTPSTSSVLERADLRVDIAATGGSLALAKAVAESAEAKGAVIVWLTSAAGLVEPEQQEAARVLRGVAELHRIVAYETRSPDGLGEQLRLWHGKRVGAVFFSPSACRGFVAARNSTGTGPLLERIVCVGQSTLRSWSQLRSRGLPAALYQADEEAFVAWATVGR